MSFSVFFLLLDLARYLLAGGRPSKNHTKNKKPDISAGFPIFFEITRIPGLWT